MPRIVHCKGPKKASILSLFFIIYRILPYFSYYHLPCCSCSHNDLEEEQKRNVYSECSISMTRDVIRRLHVQHNSQI